MEENKLKKWNFSASDLPLTTNYYMMDVLKFVCAILVFFIHLPPLSSDAFQHADIINYYIRNYAARIAVPFYFTSAGFLLFRKVDLNNFDSEIIIKYVKKIACLYGLWLIVQFVGGNSQMWYMGGLIIAVIIIGVMIKCKFSFKKMAIVSGVLYLIWLLCDTYSKVMVATPIYKVAKYPVKAYITLFGTNCNGLFMGVPFMFLGLLFAKKKITLSKTTAICGLIISGILMFLERVFINKLENLKDFPLSIMLFPTVFFMMYIATHAQLKPNAIYKKLRVSGMIVFYAHFLIYQFVSWGCAAVNKIFHYLPPQYIENLTALVITIAIGFLFEYLTRKEKFKHLKLLIS
ncbi:MAG: acyltransferase family protein [Clostridiales bacterium]|nr:acyltransferase family protein [Candidatus Equinaster intestinalis]